MKNIYLTGASGFVGSHLKKMMESRGWDVKTLSRSDFAAGSGHLQKLIDGSDAVVHLAGAPIARRWNAKVKQELRDSRILTTRALSEAICACQNPPRVFVSASAVGIYEGFGIHDENSTALAQDFLGRLCLDWEAEAKRACDCSRVVNPRIGLVLGRDGGILQRQLPVFRMGLGGPIGCGRQGFPFIHIHDLCRAFIYILENESLQGPVNVVAPELVDNRTFAFTMGKILRKPAFWPVPRFALWLLFGQGAEAITAGQFVQPAKLLAAGFEFTFPHLKEALTDLIVKQ